MTKKHRAMVEITSDHENVISTIIDTLRVLARSSEKFYGQGAIKISLVLSDNPVTAACGECLGDCVGHNGACN